MLMSDFLNALVENDDVRPVDGVVNADDDGLNEFTTLVQEQHVLATSKRNGKAHVLVMVYSYSVSNSRARVPKADPMAILMNEDDEGDDR